MIREDFIQEKRKPIPTPDPGAYDKHLLPIGSGLNNVTMGRPYEFKAKEGPAPGQYDADLADSVTKPKGRFAHITNE